MVSECEVINLASRQHGVVSTAQAAELGLGRHHIAARLSAGRWRLVHDGVYVIGAAPPTRHQALMAACLAAGGGAVASHRAAAWLWGLDGFSSAPTELTLATRRGARPVGVLLHHTQRFHEVDRTVQAGVPVTTRDRTLIDLGAVVRPLRV